MTSQKHIGIVGGGLVGSLMSLYLAERGYRVTVYERRQDPRVHKIDGGRSINLALSRRGIRALEEVGLGHVLQQTAIPMTGRMMHDLHGNLTFQPYGKEGQYINSVSRTELNKLLIDAAESRGIQFFFEQRCLHIDMAQSVLTLQSSGSTYNKKLDAIIGADGAFSTARLAMQLTDRFDYSQDYIDHGYKEFLIPAKAGDEFAMAKNALHIWPRESYMLIALPNLDGSFTGTLFFPFEGSPSFQSLREPEQVAAFFARVFPDALSLIPDLQEQYANNPTSSLVTVRCYPWHVNRTFLLGDAAHAIVPFYGQGMNAGFEDCRVLNELLIRFSNDLSQALPEFERSRKPDTDAIAELALDNFIEMRDLVGDPEFLLRKKIEARIHQLHPERWIPLYSMVTFHEEIRYSEALKQGQQQKKIMDQVMGIPAIESIWQTSDFQPLLHQIMGD
ncbi:MAG TPA: NAD(P)/FAD-dependent oxidoreductase [Chryseolinea sp.]|nr:NAD(P)/FAD-dependent oxidoreductase [Chryseolinea sp.]